MSHRVVAFLQNCWFKAGTNPRTIELYLTDQDFRRRVLARSMSGGRLHRAFGEHFNKIWWDNASQYVATTSSGRGAADTDHMRKICISQDPYAIISFGRVATDGFCTAMDEWQLFTGTDFLQGMKWYNFPHPNKRGMTQSELDIFARRIIDLHF